MARIYRKNNIDCFLLLEILLKRENSGVYYFKEYFEYGEFKGYICNINWNIYL